MANLRGGNFDKQIKDAFYRVQKLGQGRHMQEDNFTHSLALSEKRQMYLKDFKQYLEEQGIKEGKLNTYMTQELVKEFLEARVSDLSPKSALDYTAGFNSLLKGMEQANITIPSNPSKNDFLKDFREQFRQEMKELKFETNRYINNIQEKLQELKQTRYESYVIAKVQYETGLRVNEAREVIRNFDKYYNSQTSSLQNVVGKGNHIYEPKLISSSLVKQVQKVENVPHYNTYRQDLKEVGITKSHDFRVSYAKDKTIEKLEEGKNYEETLKEVSKEINHFRESMTQYYLDRS